VEVKADVGNAFNLGVYNGQLPSPFPVASPDVKDFKDGKYHLVDCGVFDFAGDSYLWLAPKNNPDQVGRILVDRVLLVKEQ